MSAAQGPGEPPMDGGYRPMGAPQTGGRLSVRRPWEINASFAVWLAGAAVSVAWIVVRALDLHSLAGRAAQEARRDPVSGMSDAAAAHIVLKWGYIFLGLWAVTTAVFVLFAFFMRAGQSWARIALTALAVLVVLLVLNASHPLAFVSAGCGVLGTVLFYLPNANAYVKLMRTP